MGLCDCMMKLASPELLDIAIDKLFAFCKLDLPGKKLLIKECVSQSRIHFTPDRDRRCYTKKKVQGAQYFLFSRKVGDVEENFHLCFSALCAFYGYCHKQMARILQNNGTTQLSQHGLKYRVSNHSMNAEITESLHDFFNELKSNSEPHSISVVRTHVGLSLKQDNDNIWLGSHHSRRSLYLSWLAHRGYRAQSDSKGSYGTKRNYEKISDDNFDIPVCCCSNFYKYWRDNYSKMKIRKPYVDTCGVCFQFKLEIYKLQRSYNDKRSRYMCMEDDIHKDILMYIQEFLICLK